MLYFDIIFSTNLVGSLFNRGFIVKELSSSHLVNVMGGKNPVGAFFKGVGKVLGDVGKGLGAAANDISSSARRKLTIQVTHTCTVTETPLPCPTITPQTVININGDGCNVHIGDEVDNDDDVTIEE